MNTIIVINSDKMGNGEEVLGAVLIKSFIFKLTESEIKPTEILLYNSAVTLISTDSELAYDFSKLIDCGVKIKACGTCLSYYQLDKSKIIGEVTNMEYIVSSLMSADKVIRV